MDIILGAWWWHRFEVQLDKFVWVWVILVMISHLIPFNVNGFHCLGVCGLNYMMLSPSKMDKNALGGWVVMSLLPHLLGLDQCSTPCSDPTNLQHRFTVEYSFNGLFRLLSKVGVRQEIHQWRPITQLLRPRRRWSTHDYDLFFLISSMTCRRGGILTSSEAAERAQHSGHHLAVLLLDFEKAFDRVDGFLKATDQWSFSHLHAQDFVNNIECFFI